MWVEYKNGNYTVKLNLDNGTKIRETEDDEFAPSFSESCDMTIDEHCINGCKMCYANCTPDGKYADFSKYEKLLDSLHEYTELAINGNNLDHPELISFLHKMTEKHVVVNMTVNQIDFEKNIWFLRLLTENGLIHGLGISVNNPTREFVHYVKLFPNAVLHVINGILSPSDVDVLKNQNLKVLILGYKTIGRGEDWYAEDHENIVSKQIWLKENLAVLIPCFKVLSFDNLALEQLNVKDLLTEEQWDEFFMGNDGQFTFFINLVQGYFAQNSLSDTHYPIGDLTIDEMFEIIKQNLRR